MTEKTPYENDGMAHDAYQLFTDGNEFVVARDEEHVKRLLVEKFGYDESEVAGPWKVVPRDKTLTILFEDPETRESKPCAEWIKQYGPGWLAGYEY